MQGSYSVYWPETGEIICMGSVSPLTMAADQLDGYPDHYIYSDAVDGEKQYMLAGAPTDRPTLSCLASYVIAADGVVEVSFPLPSGTVVRYAGAQFTSTGEPFAFTTDIPGTYVFDVEPPFPYIPRILMIEATDAV